MRIQGLFETKFEPKDFSLKGENEFHFDRFLLHKSYHGKLEAKSEGEMISARTPTKGSAGYVAIEDVRGALDGKSGGFVLQHFGIMDRGKDRLILEVVPDSGTEEFAGISGSMKIEIVDDKHHYTFDYELK